MRQPGISFTITAIAWLTCCGAARRRRCTGYASIACLRFNACIAPNEVAQLDVPANCGFAVGQSLAWRGTQVSSLLGQVVDGWHPSFIFACNRLARGVLLAHVWL